MRRTADELDIAVAIRPTLLLQCVAVGVCVCGFVVWSASARSTLARKACVTANWTASRAIDVWFINIAWWWSGYFAPICGGRRVACVHAQKQKTVTRNMTTTTTTVRMNYNHSRNISDVSAHDECVSLFSVFYAHRCFAERLTHKAAGRFVPNCWLFGLKITHTQKQMPTATSPNTLNRTKYARWWPHYGIMSAAH